MSGLIREQALVSVYSINDFQQKKLKNEIKTEREGRYKNSLTQIQNQMNGNEKSLSTITQGRKEYQIACCLKMDIQYAISCKKESSYQYDTIIFET